MSSGIVAPPPLPPEVPLATLPTENEGYIDQRLRQTRRQVKTVDIAGGLAMLAIGALLYLLVAALADHWLIVGGLGSWGRWLLWLGLVGTAGTFFAFRVLPPLMHRVNPVFAASTIEKSRPSLRNSLINFLLLRGQRREMAAPVYNALEQRAAADLSQVRIETAVDRTHLVRLCCALAVVLALFSLYLVFSPKNPLRSAARVLFPWSNVAAPTRVTIDDVLPGDTAAFHGEFITVSAELAGLRDGETPLLIYSTADDQSVDQAVPMTSPKGEYRYQCRLPPGKLGLRQDYKYQLSAGDCRTPVYLIEVRNAPAIVVDKVVYRYPGYTGLADQTLENQGDLRAIEGTEATIHATANTEIKPATAELDLGCTGRRGLRMTADGYKATGSFRLRLSEDDNSTPEYDCYQLRFYDLQGNENTRPVRHRIEVVRDLPPEVQLIEPQEPEVQVAENGRLKISVRAKDPDFALRRVTLRAVRDDNRSLSIPPLLEKRRPEKAVQGEFQTEYVFEPARLGLKAGDRVQYWAEVEDNKEPTANRSETEKRWIVVASPEARDEQQQQEGAKGDRSDQPKEQEPSDDPSDRRDNADRQPSEDPAEKQPSRDESQSPNEDQNDRQQGESSGDKQDGEQGEQSDGKQQSDKQSGSGDQGENQQGEGEQDGQSDRRIDPQAEPGDAMQEILKDRQRQQDAMQEVSKDRQRQQKDQSSEDKPQPENQQPDEQQGDKQPQPSEKQQADSQQERDNQSQPDETQSGDQRQPTDDQETGTGQSSGDKQEEGQAGGEQAGDKQSGEEQSAGAESPQEKGGSEAGDGQESAAGKDAAGQSETESQKSAAEKADGEKGAGEPSESQRKDQKAGGQEESGDDSADGERSGSKSGKSQQQPTSDQKPGEQKPGRQDRPGPGEQSGDETGSPLPQEEAQQRDKQRPDKPGQAPGERKEDDAQSPGMGNKESDAKSDTAGDRKGGGEKGGGQQSDQPGVGGPGSNTPADEGASQADEQGEGATGSRPGDGQESKEPTGSEQKTPGSGHGKRDAEGSEMPGGKHDAQQQSESDDSNERGEPLENPDKSGIPTGKGQKPEGSGAVTGGGKPGKAGPTDLSGSGDESADRANLDYARRQTTLALEHLRDQVAKENPELLKRLGWTKADARRFLARWEEMQRAAENKGVAGEKAKKRFDDALKSLGLRPRGTELKRGGVETEKSGTPRDAGRFAPPPDWADQFRAYTRGISGGDRRDVSSEPADRNRIDEKKTD